MYQGESSQHAVNRDLAFCYGDILNYRSQYDAIGFGGNPTFELRFSFWGSGGSIHRQLYAKSENSFNEQVSNIRKNSKEGIPYGSAAILSLNYDDLPGQIKYAIGIPVSSDSKGDNYDQDFLNLVRSYLDGFKQLENKGREQKILLSLVGAGQKGWSISKALTAVLFAVETYRRFRPMERQIQQIDLCLKTRTNKYADIKTKYSYAAVTKVLQERGFINPNQNSLAEFLLLEEVVEQINLSNMGLNANNLASVIEGSLGGKSLKINKLILNNNPLSLAGLQKFQELSLLIPALPNIQIIDLQCTEISDEAFPVIFQIIEACPHLTRLDLRGNLMSEQGLKNFASNPQLVFLKNRVAPLILRITGDRIKSLSESTYQKWVESYSDLILLDIFTESQITQLLTQHSQKLCFNGHFPDAKKVKYRNYVFTALKLHQQIGWLDLSHNSWDEAGLEALFKILNEVPVMGLSLAYSQLPNNNSAILIKQLSLFFQKSKSLKFLDLRGNALASQDIQVFVECLHGNDSLLGLNLSDNPISDDGLVFLMSATKNSRLVHIRLTNTKLSAASRALFLQELKIFHNKGTRWPFASLKDNLNLWDEEDALETATTECEQRSFRILQDSICTHAPIILKEKEELATTTSVTFETLDLSGEILSEAQINYLVESIGYFHEIKEINLAKTGLSTSAVQRLVEAINKAQLKIQRLILKGNELKSAGVIALQDLNQQDVLQELDLQKTQLDDQAVEHLSRTLKQLKQLISLNLIGNRFGYAGLQTLALALIKMKCCEGTPFSLKVEGDRLAGLSDDQFKEWINHYSDKILLDIFSHQQLMRLLVKESQKEELQCEIDVIKKNDQLYPFYDRIQKTFMELFLAYKTLQSGKIAHSTDKVDSLATILNLLGSVPLPGTGMATMITSEAIKKGHALQQENSAKKITDLSVNIREAEKIIETIARQLAYRYEEQLAELTEKGMQALADCAVGKMVIYLKRGKFKMNAPTVDQLISAVSGAWSTEDYALNWLKVGFIQTPHFFKKFTHKLKSVVSEKKALTHQKRDWNNLRSVLEKPAIKVLTGNEIEYYDDSHLGKKAVMQPERYGYRQGSSIEATQLGLQRTIKKSKEVVSEEMSDVSPNKSPRSIR